MEKTLIEVNERLRRAEEKRKRYAEREKVLRKKAAELTVKARTHRLCTRGGMLEAFLQVPEDLSDTQVELLLKTCFAQSAVKQLLDKWVQEVRTAKAEAEAELAQAESGTEAE